MLDREHPGWANKINTRALDLGDGCFCILGQLEGSFVGALERRGWPLFADSNACVLGLYLTPDEALGFDIVGDDEDYTELQDAWLEAIAERISAAPVATWTHRDLVQS